MKFQGRFTRVGLAVLAAAFAFPAVPAEPPPPAAGVVQQRHVRNGVAVDFSLAPAGKIKFKILKIE